MKVFDWILTLLVVFSAWRYFGVYLANSEMVLSMGPVRKEVAKRGWILFILSLILSYRLWG